MSSRRRFRLVASLAATVALTAGLAACSNDSDSNAATDHPVVVASTDVWASVASAVAGDDADVSALFDTPGGDPHEFEPTNADAAKVLDADVLVMNGGGYDEYMERIASEFKGEKVSAMSDETHATGGAELSNEHAFYALGTVSDTADGIADALAKIAPEHADAYHSNAKDFRAKVDGLVGRMEALGKAHPGTKVAATEPLATNMLAIGGIVDAAPESFTEAVEEGQSPSAADRAKFDDLLSSHQVSALIYNVQAVDPATEAVLKTATTANVPVVKYTETLPEGVTDFVTWQSGQIDQLEKALNG
ncbi:metal ABC transporter solute-binding protein, Zn/Mn family [Gordonia humi]|uniref:Zinc/manganese transport system substrate-binding protein n=1 Tax=Gordonia humi TaxID=686429 RepID=A0A840F2M7_9ACTN|nr:zinc ABC transporter substrate-binding protein [Gordonia humi]MBB4134560.1 zinc/manganese transport system substrate-binding protein [Gordonia humi]